VALQPPFGSVRVQVRVTVPSACLVIVNTLPDFDVAAIVKVWSEGVTVTEDGRPVPAVLKPF
jgi:hypothetical protein